jgi:hypothetical protein
LIDAQAKARFNSLIKESFKGLAKCASELLFVSVTEQLEKMNTLEVSNFLDPHVY